MIRAAAKSISNGGSTPYDGDDNFVLEFVSEIVCKYHGGSSGKYHGGSSAVTTARVGGYGIFLLDNIRLYAVLFHVFYF